jgi:type VII secretion integral membrane protein EccD
VTIVEDIPRRRVTVVAPTTRIDVALPAEATVAEVVVQLTGLLGLDARDARASSGGWELARLGEEPLSGGPTIGSSGVGDGEMLYLTARSSRQPAAVFDDVIDAIAGVTRARSGQWQTSTTRWTGLAIAAGAILGAAGLVMTAGPGWGGPAAAAGILAVLLTGGAVAASRALGDVLLGVGSAVAGTGFAALTGVLVVGGDRPLAEMGAAQVLLAGVGVIVIAAAGLAAVGDRSPLFVGMVVVGVLAASTATLRLLSPLSAGESAAVVAATLLLLPPLIPTLGLRLARLPFPRVPADTAEFRRDERPVLDIEVLDRTLLADGFALALSTAIGMVTFGCLVLTASSRTTPGLLLAAVVSVVLVLRARSSRQIGQRFASAGFGAALAVAAGAFVAVGLDHTTRLALVVPLLALAAIGTLAAPRWRPSPYLSRALDVVEFAAVLAVLPLLAWVTGLYATVRGLGG